MRIITSIVLVILAVLSLTGALDHKGKEFTEEALSRSMIAFGIARGLNSVISVAQGTELSVQPAGVGLTFTPGQALDPVNDLIEKFSSVMLTSAASIGIQEVLLTIGSSQIFALFVCAVIAALLVLIWKPDILPTKVSQIIFKFAVIFIFLRFAIPTLAISGDWVFSTFLEPRYNEAQAALISTREEISSITKSAQPTKEETQGIIDKVGSFFNSAGSMLDFSEQSEQYKAAAEKASKHSITLIVIFVFHTILLPIGYLYLMMWVVKGLITSHYEWHWHRLNDSK